MKLIDVSLLKEHPRNDEFFDDITGERWEEFLESIRTSGIIVPLVITQDYTVVSGNQRLRAAKKLGMKEVPCEIREYQDKDGVSKEDLILKDLIETNLRQRGIGNLNPMKTARCILELERIYGIRHGNNQYLGSGHETVSHASPKISQTELAQNIGITERRLQQLKKLNDLIPELQKLLEEGKLSSSAGTQLAFLEPEQQRELYEVLGEQIGSLKREEIQNIRKEAEEYKKRADEIQRKLVEAETEKQKIERMKAELEEKLKNIKPQIVEKVIEKVPDDYQTMKDTFNIMRQQAEQLNKKLAELQEEKKKLEEQNKQHLMQLQELQKTNKKLQEENQKYLKELTDTDVARTEEKYNFQLRRKLSDFAGEINKYVGEIEMLLRAKNDKNDKGIGILISEVIKALDHAKETLQVWDASDERMVQGEYRIVG